MIHFERLILQPCSLEGQMHSYTHPNKNRCFPIKGGHCLIPQIRMSGLPLPSGGLTPSGSGTPQRTAGVFVRFPPKGSNPNLLARG